MDFRTLQNRLLARVKARVRNGELTERGLAKLTGYSQPHVHNVFDGTRPLSIDFSDALLCNLRIDLADLLSVDQENHAGAAGKGEPATRSIGLLAGPIGPGHPYPADIGPESYPFPVEDVKALELPVAARLTDDPAMEDILGRNGVALLDCAEGSCRHPDAESLYAVDLGNESAIRRVSISEGRLYIQDRSGGDGGWTAVTRQSAPLRQIIRARLHLLVRRI